MRGHANWHQRGSVGVVMIEAAGKSFALGAGQRELEFVSTAARWIRPAGVPNLGTAVEKVALPFQPDTRGAVEKPRKLGERDRLLVIEAARRMTFTQELRDRRDCLRRRGRELAQIDLFPGPRGPHRRWRRNDARIRIHSAQRVGLPACGAARVEQKIVKVPKHEVVVALCRSEATAAGVDLEEDFAIQEQGEKLDPRKAVL